MNERRLSALDAVLRSLKTGEYTAVQEAAATFASSVVYKSGATEVSGTAAVAERLTGQWPLTPVYAKGEWTEPEASGESVRISASFPTFGTIKGYALSTTFDKDDRITRIDETVTMFPAPAATDRFPAVVRTAINGALANGTPLVVGYTGKDGAPVLSLRGSTQVYGPTELCIWVRNPKGGLVDAARDGRALSFLYRDSARRMTLVMTGTGSIADDAATRDRIWTLTPEVERRHDPDRKGAALLIHIQKASGNTPSGPVLVTAPKA